TLRHHITRRRDAEGKVPNRKTTQRFGCCSAVQPRPPPLPDRSEAIRGERPGWQVRSKALGLPPSGQAVPVDHKSETGEACANCGKHGSDTVKLKNCTACRLVKYCGVDCQRTHRKQHKKACKQRAAELKDEQLYGRGLERPEGDFCPICTLPIPLPMDRHSTCSACLTTKSELVMVVPCLKCSYGYPIAKSLARSLESCEGGRVEPGSVFGRNITPLPTTCGRIATRTPVSLVA
ncbi:hypothetical protein THAOC_13754, partial [Thalassiosira oceanica]